MASRGSDSGQARLEGGRVPCGRVCSHPVLLLGRQAPSHRPGRHPPSREGPRVTQLSRRKANPFGANALTLLNTPTKTGLVTFLPDTRRCSPQVSLFVPPPSPPPLLGGITVRETMAAVALANEELSIPDLSQQHRLFGTRWYHDEVFVELQDKLSLWANLISPSHSWHVCSGVFSLKWRGSPRLPPLAFSDRLPGLSQPLTPLSSAMYQGTGSWPLPTHLLDGDYV